MLITFSKSFSPWKIFTFYTSYNENTASFTLLSHQKYTYISILKTNFYLLAHFSLMPFLILTWHSSRSRIIVCTDVHTKRQVQSQVSHTLNPSAKTSHFLTLFSCTTLCFLCTATWLITISFSLPFFHQQQLSLHWILFLLHLFTFHEITSNRYSKLESLALLRCMHSKNNTQCASLWLKKNFSPCNFSFCVFSLNTHLFFLLLYISLYIIISIIHPSLHKKKSLTKKKVEKHTKVTQE